MSRYLPGDIVSRRKGIVMHKGVALGDGRVLHNTPFRGEHICSETEFRAGKRLHVNHLDYEDRRRALRFTEDHDHRGYNLFTNNCEHTVHRASTGTASSPQLREWVIGIGLGTLAFALTRHPGVTAAAYALGRGLSKKFG